jgi:molybdate transport system ATP-binding protein
MHLNFHKKLWTESGPMPLQVSLELEPGALLGIHGPSGAGKSMLLRCIAGLERPDEGRIEVDGAVWFDSSQGIFVPPQHRKIGFLFQDSPLFSHLSVDENLKFACSDTNPREGLLEKVGLTGLSNAYPSALSGGQRQRIALAQALARQPSLLLLDEPFSSLDPFIRISIQNLIEDFHKRCSLTSFLVSHQMEDLLRMADRVVEVQEGKIISDLSRNQLLEQTASKSLRVQGEIIQTSDLNSYMISGNSVYPLNGMSKDSPTQRQQVEMDIELKVKEIRVVGKKESEIPGINGNK